MLEKLRDRISVTDDDGRVIFAYTIHETGEIMLATPEPDKKGHINRIVRMSRKDARAFAQEILVIVGEHDQ